MTGLVDEGRTVNIVCFDFSKDFDIVSDNILTDKLLKYGLDEERSELKTRLPGPEDRDQWYHV